MSCYQGITFTVSFCEHSHTFVKISEFVMVNEVMGIPVEMAQFTLFLPHPCTVENICMSQCGFKHELACLTIRERTYKLPPLQVPQPSYQPLSILTFTCNRYNFRISFVE